MAKNKQQKSKELDSVYFLKLVAYLIIGSLWFKVTNGQSVQVAIPVGLMIGLAFALHDHVEFDRKMGFAVLLVAMLVGLWAPYGIYLLI